MSQRKLSLFPKGAHQSKALLCAPQRPARGQGKMLKILRAKIGHSVILPVAPDVFGGIEFRSIGRKSGQDDLAVLFAQEIPNLATTMNRQAIPDDKQLSLDLAAQVREEVQHLWCTNSSRIQPEVKLPPGNAGNHRKLLPVKMKFQLWRLTAGRPSAADMWTLGDATFIYKDDGTMFAEGFFLRAGQVYRCQRRMASSSRSMALREGRWQLHPRWRSTFQTWPGWYVTPQVSRITPATRGKVQRQLLYPCASGPSSKARLICLWTPP